MKHITLRAPVIIMGMHKSGTTLVAEMIHKGGVPMFSGDHDPSYDDGIKYERPLCQELNLAALGLDKQSRPLDPIWQLPLQPLPADTLEKLASEVKDQPWGFKDPRTTFTYSEWLNLFPDGPRVYVYRGHLEIFHRFFKGKRISIKKAIVGIRAWLHYNEKMLENFDLDKKAGRPAVLVRYEELMTDRNLILKLEQILSLKFFDARNLQLHRNKAPDGLEKVIAQIVTLAFRRRIKRLYAELDARRVIS